MKRKLAIWLHWRNFSDYHSRQLAAAIEDEYDTTVTYKPLDWSEFDVVLPFFPGPNKQPDCEREKIVKFVWEPHEDGWAKDAGTVCAASTLVYERIKRRYKDRAVYLPWGINPAHFYPAQFMRPSDGRHVVGWAGSYKNPRKQYDRLDALMSETDGIKWRPNKAEMGGGVQTGPYTMETMHRYYHSIDVLVCASSSEGFCFPLLEATACGRPVVTFDVGCARDLLQSGAGVVIVDDFDQLKAAVKVIRYQAFGAMSVSATRRHWTWERLRGRWLEVLANAGN
jgi:glycosyltransferase involved in cell wall biosynthesis